MKKISKEQFYDMLVKYYDVNEEFWGEDTIVEAHHQFMINVNFLMDENKIKFDYEHNFTAEMILRSYMYDMVERVISEIYPTTKIPDYTENISNLVTDIIVFDEENNDAFFLCVNLERIDKFFESFKDIVPKRTMEDVQNDLKQLRKEIRESKKIDSGKED